MRLQLFIQDDYVVIDNGSLQLALTKPGGQLKIIQYTDIDNLLELHNKDLNGVSGTLIGVNQEAEEQEENSTRTNFNVVLENEEQIELSFTRTWDPSLQGDHSPLFIDTRFVTLKDVSDFYSYAIFEHLEDMPAFNLNTTRIAFMLNRDKFKYMAIADNIQRYMPDLDDRLPGREEALAYPEAVRLINPIEPEFIGEVDDKYEYSCENKDNRVHGWICIDPDRDPLI